MKGDFPLKKKIDVDEILKLTNLAENFNTSELIDNCLSKNHKKTLNILNNKEIGSFEWIEYRELKQGSSAFKEIHDGKCTAPKIILLT